MSTVDALYAEIQDKLNTAGETGDLQTIGQQIAPLEALLNDAPGHIGVVFSLATAKMIVGGYGAAIPYFEWLSTHLKDTAEIWNNLGSCWKALNRDAEAEFCWKRALDIRPDADYYNNLATLHVNMGRPDEGIPHLLKSFSLNPLDARQHWNYALLQLEKGNWRIGFNHFDHGMASHDRPVRFYHNDREKVPFWEGEPGKLVVYGEQGMGDEIMFASCLNDIENEVIFDCHDRMVGLFERSFPNIKHYPTRKKENLEWPKDEEPDYKVAIGSLFKPFRSKGEFPKKPYLQADPHLVEMYRKRLLDLGAGPYIGIGWKGGYRSTRNDLRSLKLSWFNPVFEKGGTFISLQYTGDTADKVGRFNDENGRDVIHHWQDVIEATGPDGSRYTGFDYDHTAALVCALDLCIVPNTTVAHLCGALGENCWTLTPDGPAWRYQLEGDEMPMYGSWVRQIRQGGRDWRDVLEQVGREYEDLYRGARAEPAIAESG